MTGVKFYPQTEKDKATPVDKISTGIYYRGNRVYGKWVKCVF